MRAGLALGGLLGLLSAPAATGTLDSLLGPVSPSCVLMVAVEKAATVIPLSPDQFAFARGVYVATPPMSPTLPPGDKAVLIEADGAAIVALVTGEGAAAETCARFNAPPSFLKMLSDIAAGKAHEVGRPL